MFDQHFPIAFTPPPTLHSPTPPFHSVSMSLESMYKWDYATFIFLHLVYFSEQSLGYIQKEKVYPCCYKWQDFLLLCICIMFFMYMYYVYVYVLLCIMYIFYVYLCLLLLILYHWATWEAYIYIGIHTHTHTCHFPYLFIHQQTCCCHVLFIVNNTIMNMRLQASLKDTDFVFEYVLLSEIVAI